MPDCIPSADNIDSAVNLVRNQEGDILSFCSQVVTQISPSSEALFLTDCQSAAGPAAVPFPLDTSCPLYADIG